MGKRVKVGNKIIGAGEPCFVIAEIGINHNGCVKTAKSSKVKFPHLLAAAQSPAPPKFQMGHYTYPAEEGHLLCVQNNPDV